MNRCWWCGDDPLYVQYHDREWGVPVDDDQRLFEKICLEGFQAGLSWITILRKREAFRELFFDFDFNRIARFTSGRVDKLVADARIIRHRGKIESTINNARRAIEAMESYGSLGSLLWRFEPGKTNVIHKKEEMVATTRESSAMSKELKRLGFTFVGPTTCYAMMQAVGMVNDHLRDCNCWEKVDRAQKRFKRPA